VKISLSSPDGSCSKEQGEKEEEEEGEKWEEKSE
jgi:hypothetical protein